MSRKLLRDLPEAGFPSALYGLLGDVVGGGDLLDGLAHRFPLNNVLRLVRLKVKSPDVTLCPPGPHCGQQGADGLTAAVQ